MTNADIFRQIYTDVKTRGVMCAPRGQKVLELEHYTYQLPAYARFPAFECRKLNINYIKREFLWYLRGNRADTSITAHAKIWADVQGPDGINSNYGQYIFNQAVARVTTDGMQAAALSQLEIVVQELLQDNDSRRASMMILGMQHFNRPTKDLPCTYSLNFRIRQGKLNMSVHMRSQDAIFGMGNDAPTFSFIHEMVLESIKMRGIDLELGTYFHTADSFHVYERHFEMLDLIVAGSPFIEIDCPRINGLDEVHHLIYDIHTRYQTGERAWNSEQVRRSNNYSPKLAFEAKAEASYDKFAFSNWLLEPELESDRIRTENANAMPTMEQVSGTIVGYSLVSPPSITQN